LFSEQHLLLALFHPPLERALLRHVVQADADLPGLGNPFGGEPEGPQTAPGHGQGQVARDRRRQFAPREQFGHRRAVPVRYHRADRPPG